MEKFQNKYRIPSARAAWWNYGWANAYFITVCTKNGDHLFGEIENSNMQLSNLGVLADVFWHEIPKHTQNVELGAFVVMPNHIHGILILTEDAPIASPIVPPIVPPIASPIVPPIASPIVPPIASPIVPPIASPIVPPIVPPIASPIVPPIVQTLHATSLPQKNEKMAAISPKNNTISTIIRSYKSAVTKHANRLNIPNGWLARFHDRIIRNDAEYQRINDYIENNPKNWKNA